VHHAFVREDVIRDYKVLNQRRARIGLRRRGTGRLREGNSGERQHNRESQEHGGPDFNTLEMRPRDTIPEMLRRSWILLVCFAIPALPQGGIGGRAADVPAAVARNAGPAPRLPDGKPDLGNGKGVWNPRTITNLSGDGPQGRGRSPVEKVIEI